MTIAKLVLAAALTLASGAAFAGQQDRAQTANRGTVQKVAMERTVVESRRTITGLAPSAPTIFGHEPLSLQYDRPLHSNN